MTKNAQALAPRQPSQVGRALQRAATSIHSALYRATGGRIGHYLGKIPCLLLTTTGRKTGKRRTTVLTYVADSGIYALVASNGGTLRDPLWWRNLQAQPAANIQVGARRLRVIARQATPDEKARLWPLALALYPGYAGYQQRTPRDIPMVILQPSV